MSRKCLYILSLLFLFQSVSEAQIKIAPLVAELDKPLTDTQRLNVYRSIHRQLKHAHTDSAIFYLERALQEFTASGYKFGRAAALGMLASSYSERNLAEAAEKAGTEALAIFTDLHDQLGIAKAHNVIGVLEGKKGHFPEAIKHFLLALDYFEKTSDTDGMINCYIRLGTANDLVGGLQEAMKYYEKGLGMSLAYGISANTAMFYNNMGTLHAKLHNHDTALVYFDKALKIAEDPRYREVRVSVLLNKGNVYNERRNHEKALELYHAALKIARQSGLKEQEGRVMHSIGIAEAVMRNSKTRALDEAYRLAVESGSKSAQIHVLRDMARLAEQNGDFEREVELMRMERELSDSLFSMEKAKEIADLQSRYELSKSRTELAALKQSQRENHRKQQQIKLIASILAVTLVTMLFFLLRTIRLNRRLKLREKQLGDANAVKDRLFSVIGHDLRGPAGNIPALIRLYRASESEEEKEYILNGLEENASALLETLEKLLGWGSLQLKGTTLRKTDVRLNELCEETLRLVRISASGKNITINNGITAETHIYADENHIKFILRNLLSNAIKFTHTGGQIDLLPVGAMEEGQYIFAVKDNGVGIEPERLATIFEPFNTSTHGTAKESGTSLGLMLCREFVQLNGGRIWVESEKGRGTAFYVSVPQAFEDTAGPPSQVPAASVHAMEHQG